MDINIQREGHSDDSLDLTLLQIVLTESGLRMFLITNMVVQLTKTSYTPPEKATPHSIEEADNRCSVSFPW